MRTRERNDGFCGLSVATTLGTFEIGATHRGIRALRFPVQPPLQGCACPPEGSVEHGFLTAASQWLQSYINGVFLPQGFPLDLDWCTPFGRQVFLALREVEAGSTVSYSTLAAAVSSHRAARAVGTWLARNELPVVLPCHRVVSHDGSMGGWSGPPGMKEKLLSLEARQTIAPGVEGAIGLETREKKG